MIVYLANKTQFRDDILSNRIEEIVHDSFKVALWKTDLPKPALKRLYCPAPF
jgi:hypothetical protein